MSTVQQLVDSIKYTINNTRVTGAAGIASIIAPWINDALHEIDWALYVEKSDMVRTPLPAISFAIGDASKPLPADFLAFHRPPYITGQTERLTLVPAEDALYILAMDPAALPTYYAIRGRTLSIYAVPSVAVTVAGSYFKWSATVVDGDSVVPYDGLLDAPIRDYIVKLYAEANTTRDKSGELLLSGGTQTMAQLKAEMIQQVKAIALLRPGIARRRPTYARYF